MARQSGYTLIELIVVLLIIGLTITLVIPRLSLPDNQGKLEQHRQNIETLIKLARDQSIIRGQILGLGVKNNTLSILQLKQGKWQAAKFDKPLQDYLLSDAYDLSLTLGDSLFELPDDQKPYAMILPDGQTSAFTITLQEINNQSGYEIQITAGKTQTAAI